jgi:hypothetical protein
VKDAFCLLDEFEAGLRAHFEAAHATLERQARTDGAEGKPVLDGEKSLPFRQRVASTSAPSAWAHPGGGLQTIVGDTDLDGYTMVK